MKRSFLPAFLILLAFMLPQSQTAPEAADPGEGVAQKMSALASDRRLILFRASAFDPTIGMPAEAGFGLTDSRDRSSGELLYVVQFRGVPGKAERGMLERLGATVLYYVPNNAYLVKIDSGRFAGLSGEKAVRAAFRLPKFAKLDPYVTEDVTRARAVELMAAPGADFASTAENLRTRFPKAVFISAAYHHAQGRIIVEVGAGDLRGFLDAAAGLEDVLSVLPWEEPQALNDNSIWVIQNYDATSTTNYSLSATLWNHGITGTGQIVCVNDSGATNTMCSLRYDGTPGSEAIAQSLTPPDTGTITMSKKVIAYYVEPWATAYDEYIYHGSHTSGSVLGDNYATLSTPASGGHDSGDGMAPNAQLVMQDVGVASGALAGLTGDLDLMFLQAFHAGARIHSDSWGTTSSNYSPISMDMDEFTYRHEDFLFVSSMGNSGTAPGDGSIGAPATAKNVVSVGGTTNGGDVSRANDLVWYSRGPVDDGRRKPDVCSPSYYINSADGAAACSTKNTFGGTSMAAATTSGGLALLRQYFVDGWYPTGTRTAADARIPSAALMKACLVNGAMEMTGADWLGGAAISRIPSMDQGWGRTHLENALYFNGDARRVRVWDVWNANGLITGEQAEYTVKVTSGSQPLKVHLVWTDPESSPFAATNLVNNLDLEVVSPSATLYRGNVFSAGQSATGGAADVLNNVEGVALNGPATGNWTLRVKATSTPGAGGAPYSNRQGYALVATYATCASSLSAPTGLTATNNGTTGIDLAWSSVSGATGYLVYRAPGSSPPAGAYTALTQTAGNAFTDTKAQAGYTYSYEVRATDDCSESASSAPASASHTGNCALLPTFAGLSGVVNDTGTAMCDLVLSWAAATSSCPLAPGIVYNIYRGTNPYFTPNASSRIAAGHTGTTFADDSAASLSTYYYVVRAEDATTRNGGPANGGNEDTNPVMVRGTSWGSTTAPGTFVDDGGDSIATLSLAGVWRVTSQQNHTPGGTYAYHAAADGYAYPARQCIAATTPPISLQAEATPVLAYWVRYNMEFEWDGVVVEISTNGGATWAALTPDDGYPSSFSRTGSTPANTCGYPPSQGCFNGPQGSPLLTEWTQYTHDLVAYAGQTVLVRWNLSTDPLVEFEGFYLDDIAITNAEVNVACTSSDGIVSLDASAYTCSGDTIGIDLVDLDLQGAGTRAVTIASAFPDSENVTLTETPPNTGLFSGSVATSSANSPGVLALSNGNTITVTYLDADDGHGRTNVPKTDTVAADCAAPVISSVGVTDIGNSSATVTWYTNEPTDSLVTYGASIPPGTNRRELIPAYVTYHAVRLTGLSVGATYYFSVTSADPASNTTTADDGGAFYSFTTLGEGGPVAWLRRYNGPANGADSPVAVAVDGAGNVYATGSSAGNGTGDDFATIKYDSSGKRLWIARYNGVSNSYDRAHALVVDRAGNVYVTGESDNPAPGTATDYLTIKYDVSGDPLWVARYEGMAGSPDTANAIAVDDSGNVYVTGYSIGPSTPSSWDYVTVKYDASGSQLWVARYNGPGSNSDMPFALAVDGAGNAYVGGESYGGGSTNIDYALVKYDASGNQVWVARHPGTGNSRDTIRAVAVDGAGNVYVTGTCYNFPTSEDYVTIKYDKNGNQLWLAGYDGGKSDDDWAQSLALDASGNVYVTGYSRGEGSGAAHDYATVKYDAWGHQLWVRRYDGTAHGIDHAWSIALDRARNVYVAGDSPGIGTASDYVTLKYDTDGASLWEARYNGPANGADGASRLVVDGQGDLYVTGSSAGVGTAGDYFTIKYSQPGPGAGRVPGQPGWPGAPLTVTRAGAGQITLDWAVSCLVTDDDYAIYEGVLGDFTSHVSRFCGTNGATTMTFAPAAGGTYYLVAPLNASSEGSYGTDRSGVERPQGLDPCLPRRIAACP